MKIAILLYDLPGMLHIYLTTVESFHLINRNMLLTLNMMFMIDNKLSCLKFILKSFCQNIIITQDILASVVTGCVTKYFYAEKNFGKEVLLH